MIKGETVIPPLSELQRCQIEHDADAGELTRQQLLVGLNAAFVFNDSLFRADDRDDAPGFDKGQQFVPEAFGVFNHVSATFRRVRL